MALFIRNQDSRSELQERVAAELQERLRATEGLEIEKSDPAILARQHHTRWSGVIIVTLVVIGLITILVIVS